MMQLPRGTFREIRRGEAIEGLVSELNGEKFSGVANISSPSLTGTLVFRAGECILVTFQNSHGDTAWDELRRSENAEVDAVLSLLGDAQIDLALEFNRACRVQKSGKQPPAQGSHRAASSAPREHLRPVPGQKTAAPAAPAAPLKQGVRPAPARHHAPASPSAPDTPVHQPPSRPSAHVLPSHPPRVPKPPVQIPPLPPSPPVPSLRHDDGKSHGADDLSEKSPDISSFESDLDTFDTMDIDNVTDKIRTDCRTMIKQLHLDHLMER